MAAALLLAVSGCSSGSDGGQQTASDSSALAGARAAAAKLASPSAQTVHVSGTTSAGSLANVKITGVEQLQPDLAADIKFQPSGGQLGALGAGSMEVILKDGVEYLNLGSVGLRGLVPSTKPWLKADVKAMTNLPGAAGGLSSLGTVSQNTDPAQQVRLLLASANLKKVGTETVDGVRATHYSGTVDVARLVHQGAGSSLTADQLQQVKTSLQQAGLATEKIDMWLSSADLPVEFKTVANSTALGEIAADIHYSDWGAPVTITTPPADQITDVSGLGGLPHS